MTPVVIAAIAGGMDAVRRLFLHRSIVGLICAATLLLKMVVPAGYMIDAGNGRITITICAGMVPDPLTAAPLTAARLTAIPGTPAMHAAMPDHGRSRDHGRPEQPCAFAGLSAAVLAAVDPLLLAALIAFVMATGMGGTVAPMVPVPAYLHPPSHAPPLRS